MRHEWNIMTTKSTESIGLTLVGTSSHKGGSAGKRRTKKITTNSGERTQNGPEPGNRRKGIISHTDSNIDNNDDVEADEDEFGSGSQLKAHYGKRVAPSELRTRQRYEDQESHSNEFQINSDPLFPMGGGFDDRVENTELMMLNEVNGRNLNFTESERTLSKEASKSGSNVDVIVPFLEEKNAALQMNNGSELDDGAWVTLGGGSGDVTGDLFVEENWMAQHDYEDDSLKSVSIDMDENLYEQSVPSDNIVYVRAEVEVHEVPKELQAVKRPWNHKPWLTRVPSNTPISEPASLPSASVLNKKSVIRDLDRISTLQSLDEGLVCSPPLIAYQSQQNYRPSFIFNVSDESFDCDNPGLALLEDSNALSDFSGQISSPLSLHPSLMIAHLPPSTSNSSSVCQRHPQIFAQNLSPVLSRRRHLQSNHQRQSVCSDTSQVSNHSMRSDLSSILAPDREQALGEKIRGIVSKFRRRATLVKKRLEFPPTPDHSSEDDEDPGHHDNQIVHDTSSNPNLIEKKPKKELDVSKDENNDLSRLRTIALQRMVYEDFNASLYASKSTVDFGWYDEWSWHKLGKKVEFIDPRGYINIFWLALQALVFLYNAWVIPLRFFFPFVQSPDNLFMWLFCDYCGDLVYLLDLLVFKRRLLYMENGFWVKDRRRLTIHYVTKGSFRFDLLALMPTDILYLWFGLHYTIVRIPRLIKVIAFWEFIYRLDAVMAKPYILRIVKTVNYMLYLIHLNACAYYAISDWEGIGSNTFVYNGQGSAYIRCFYFATKTATSIGKNKKPTNISEILFMTASWLMGVFVFAILIGDIRDIVSNARKSASSFQKQMDAVVDYMNRNKVNKEVQGRVKMWMHYTWELQKSFDEAKVLEFLPLKTRTDIAMRVHYPTLVKVKLFRNCEPGLLKDLVIKLRPVIYLPGDHICRKDDIGTEMFIVQSGQVHVLGGIDGRVLCTLGEGSVFGEIALLGVGGMNKRTANVISVGFSNLFVLQKADLEAVLQDYPDAKQILNARARKLMKENEQRIRREEASLRRKNAVADDEVIFPLQSGKREPALIGTVLKALPETSLASALLRRGSKASQGTRSRTVSVDFGRPGHLGSSVRGNAQLMLGPGIRSWSLDQREEMTPRNFSSILSEVLGAENPSYLEPSEDPVGKRPKTGWVSLDQRDHTQPRSKELKGCSRYRDTNSRVSEEVDKISIQSFQTVQSVERATTTTNLMASAKLDLESIDLVKGANEMKREPKC
ncbi:uncharacterized protein LOC131880663 [Tigriopus californicus]|uniref:uncharacterized protein LOC131880663 n=1 Tax=Tigriopus californicus TaxID=6832 RepID=UPI0027DA0326|nr:uncharacterized protein LOC131880663 [Tigriopus californicus]